MNLNKTSLKGFSLIELMVTLLLSTMVYIGFGMLGSGVSNQLSYEDVNQKVQHYGNYILDDIYKSFKEANVSYIAVDTHLGKSVIRVKFKDGAPDIKYQVVESPNPFFNNNNTQIFKNNELIHKNNDDIDEGYNQFENKNYFVEITRFECNEYDHAEGMVGKYGAGAIANIDNVFYVVDLQIDIYKKSGSELKHYNTVDFQKTIFVTDEFI